MISASAEKTVAGSAAVGLLPGTDICLVRHVVHHFKPLALLVTVSTFPSPSRDMPIEDRAKRVKMP